MNRTTSSTTNISASPASLRSWLACLTLNQRLNTAIAVLLFCAVFGSGWFTRVLSVRGYPEWQILLILLLVAAGTLAIAAALVNRSLRPLCELRRVVSSIDPVAGVAEFTHLSTASPEVTELADAIQALVERLNTTNRQLRALSGHAINAQEEERKRIARSLHDDTGQALSTLIFNLERLENRLPEDSGELQAKLANLRQLAAHTLQDLRAIVHGLRPSILDDLGLVPAIRWYARSQFSEAGIDFQMITPEEPPYLPTRMATTLFRIAQEAVNNIVRHSGARRAVITLAFPPGEVILQIEDDGRGFLVEPELTTPGAGRHWGLVGLQERAALVGGEVNIASQPGAGTWLQVCVPFDALGEDPDG